MQQRLADTLNYRELYVQMDGGDSACKAYYKTAEGRVVEAAKSSAIIGATDWRQYGLKT